MSRYIPIAAAGVFDYAQSVVKLFKNNYTRLNIFTDSDCVACKSRM